MRVLAIDPGVTSGWALFDTDLDAPPAYGQDDQMGTCDLITSHLDNEIYPLTAVVCESYRITQETIRKTRQTASLEIIGTARWLCCCANVPFVLQSPADAKRFMTDSKLKALGWWVSTAQDHAHDALRHIGLYLAKQGYTEILRAGL